MIKNLNINVLLASLGLIAGIIFQYHFSVSLGVSVCVVIAFLVVMCFINSFIWRVKYANELWSVLIAGVFSGVGMLCSVGYFSSDFVFDNKQIYSVDVISKSYETPKKIAYKAYLHSASSSKTHVEVLFQKDSTTTLLYPHSKLLITGKEIYSTQNAPYAFNYSEYLKKQGILHRIQVDHYVLTERAKQNLPSKILNYIQEKLKENGVNPTDIAMTKALLLGQRDDIPDKIYDDYVSSGGVHLLAISGLHIGIFTSILMFILSLVIRGFSASNQVRMLFLIVILGVYTYCIGYPPSVVRAVSMYALLSVFWYLKRDKNLADAVILALFFLILIYPYYVFSVGFQLSFAAVISIITIYPLLERFWMPKNKIIRYLLSLIYVSIAAQVGVIPISLYYFHQFPLLFLLTNILILPVMGLILAVGVLVIVLSCVLFLPSVLREVYHYLIAYINGTISLIASNKSFLIRHIYFDGLYVILSFLLLLLCIIFIKKRRYRILTVFTIVLIIFLSINKLRFVKAQKKDVFYVLGSYPFSEMIHYKHSTVNVYTDSVTVQTQKNIDNFRDNNFVKDVFLHKKSLFFSVNQSNILVIDSRNLIPESHCGKVDVIVLQSSPKINLSRVIARFHPSVVVADATNFSSYVQRWKKTCEKEKIRFHSTSENGFFKYEN